MSNRQEDFRAELAASAALVGDLSGGDVLSAGPLLRYQRRSISELLAGTAVVVIEKSRRIGLTWSIAFYAVLRAAASPSAGGDHVFYMGYEKDMAIEFIEACAMWARALSIVTSAVDEEIVEDLDEEGNSKAIQGYRIRFASGFRIVSLPSVPRAFRGKQGIVIIDEAAFHAQIAAKIKAAMALLIWGGQLVVVSTHDGVDNEFAQLVDRVRSGEQPGKLITITFQDALADGLYDQVAKVAAVRGKTVVARQEWIDGIYAFYGDNASEELDVIPAQGSGTLIKPSDIAACEDADAGKPELYGGGLYVIGRDVARRRDGQIIWGFELVGDVMVLRDRYEEVGKSFAEQDDYFNFLMRERRVLQAGIDQTGMGEKVVEDLQLLHGASRVVGFLLTGPTRLDLGLSLAARFEACRIRIPADPVIRTDLRAIRRQSASGGGVRLVNDESVHADRFWAGGIASRLADFPAPAFGYRGAGRANATSGGSKRDFWRPNHSGDYRRGR